MLNKGAKLFLLFGLLLFSLICFGCNYSMNINTSYIGTSLRGIKK